jgi:hypothetical protein
MEKASPVWRGFLVSLNSVATTITVTALVLGSNGYGAFFSQPVYANADQREENDAKYPLDTWGDQKLLPARHLDKALQDQGVVHRIADGVHQERRATPNRSAS